MDSGHGTAEMHVVIPFSFKALRVQLYWWCSVLVGQCTGGAVYRWRSVLVAQCTGGAVYWWRSVLVAQCTGGAVYWWRSVLVVAKLVKVVARLSGDL